MIELRNGEIHEYKVFNEYECWNIARQVRTLKPFWIARGGGGFDTLGASVYVDDPHAYPGIAANTNLILYNNFYGAEIFKYFIETLTNIFQAEVITSPKYALPGFHIFTDKANAYEGGDVHTDSPFKRMVECPDFDRVLSFTLPVEMPKHGAAMNYWDDGVNPQMVEPKVLQYRLGCMYLHTGLAFHQIKKMADMSPGEARITLQGHGIRLKKTGEILIYF